MGQNYEEIIWEKAQSFPWYQFRGLNEGFAK